MGLKYLQDRKKEKTLLNDYISYILHKKYRVNETTGCWVWTGPTNTYGYGVIEYMRKPYLAHRLSYQKHKGLIVSGQCILHSCDNPRCVNPDHLREGTHAENMQDMVDRGRSIKGRQIPNLGWDSAREIRMMYDTGEYTQQELADQFGVVHGTITDVINYRTYKE